MINRRQFMFSAAAAAALAAWHAPVFAAEKAMEADIVVVGAGSAGLTAAVQAAEKGAKVILLEKNQFVGGCSQFAEGIFAVESELNRLRSDPMTREKAFEHAREQHLYELDPILMRDFIYGSAQNVDWFMQHGIKFEVVRMTPWEEATWHVIADYKGKSHGAGLVACMKDAADKNGVTTLLATPATALIADKSGRIVGVKAKGKDGEILIKAKAVILASGSIGDSKEKVRDWAHRDPDAWQPSVRMQKTGDGIQMALDQGAARGEVSFIAHLGTEGKAIDFTSNLYTTSWQPAALWVNSDGHRFVNEDVALSFSQAANAIYTQNGHSGWSIFDDSQVDYMMKKGIDSGVGVLVPVGTKLTELRAQIKKAIDADSDGFKAASSVKALAKKIGVPADALEKAVAEYNKYCDEGHDGLYFKDVKYMRKLDTKHLYAIRLKCYFFSAFGGLNVNRRFEVLDKAGKPMKGLYATGLDVSRAIGHTYTTWTSGYAFGFACWSGRQAALNAVKAIGL